MDHQGECFKHRSALFPFKIEAKMKQGILVGPEITKQIKDKNFKTKLSPNELDALNTFALVIQTF